MSANFWIVGLMVFAVLFVLWLISENSPFGTQEECDPVAEEEVKEFPGWPFLPGTTMETLRIVHLIETRRDAHQAEYDRTLDAAAKRRAQECDSILQLISP